VHTVSQNFHTTPISLYKGKEVLYSC